MGRIETFIYNSRYIILIVGAILELVRCGLRRFTPNFFQKISKYYRSIICILTVLFLIWCLLEKEYILAIFVPIFVLATIYYLKEIICEARHKK